MDRIDKIVSSQGQFSRAEVKKLIKKGRIAVDGRVVTDAGQKADPDSSVITLDGKPFTYKKHIYIMMNKPQGVVSASNDRSQETVVDLVPAEMRREGLFPAGRLDSDTVGFVLITDDGDFAHRILSPKNHIMKTYLAILQREVTDEDIRAFREGVTLGDGTLCLEAEIEAITLDGQPAAKVMICEGKYHQVKRMFAALGNKVLYLKRTKMGGLPLDEGLGEGECREITAEELQLIESR